LYRIDLNCDMGESYGAYRMGRDEEVLQYISSANIACGFHSGDPTTMKKTVKLCMEKGVSMGAHPGLPDLLGFGRRAIAISPDEAYDMVLYQLGALSAFIHAEGGKLHHVKPHGALYHMTVQDKQISNAIAEAVYKADPNLILFGLSGSRLVQAGKRIGLRCANEAFADRTYLPDGSLTPRSQSDAVILDVDKAVEQALRLTKNKNVTSNSGKEISIEADTLCIHGDGAHALAFAEKIIEAFKKEGIAIQSLGGQ
jgi:UPF0271 protein